MKMNLFAPITKVDVARREVWGRAVQEMVDKVDEVFDYAGSKPHFEAWSKSFSDATEGKSLGNIRAMHGKVAAGKAIAMNFNDAEKAIDIGAKIVDDNEWAKVIEGVYTGFSIGGSYVGDKKTEKVDGRDVVRYIANPSEISIVDNPCIPSAKFFDVVKADGTVEKVAFKVPAPVIEVTGTDEQVAEFAKVLNESKLTLADAIALLKNAAKPQTPAEIVKAMKAEELVDLLLPALDALTKDSATSVEKLDDKALAKMASEVLTLVEIGAAAAGDAAGTTERIRKAVLAKAKMSTANLDRLQAAHDHLQAMGADCGGEKAAPATDLSKAMETIASLQKDVDTLKKQPMPFVTLRTVRREDDGPAPTKTVDDATTDIKLEPGDYVKNADGSIDYATSRIMKAHKLAGQQA